MNILDQKNCVPCEGGVRPMMKTEYGPYLAQVRKWKVIDDKMLMRRFTFKNFKEALSFCNRIGEIAEREGHHPDILLYGWNKVKITLSTHAIGGLSINDFIVASKIDLITR